MRTTSPSQITQVRRGNRTMNQFIHRTFCWLALLLLTLPMAGFAAPAGSGMVSGRMIWSHPSFTSEIAVSPNGAIIAAGQGFGSIGLYQSTDGTLLRTLTGLTGFVRSVAFSPDGLTVAAGSVDGMIKLWNATDGALVRTLTGHTDVVYSVAFSPDGRTLASGSGDYTVRLWMVADGTLLRTLTGHGNGVDSVAFSPDGRTLASGSEDGTAKLWKVADGTVLGTIPIDDGVLAVAFSPTGQTLASAALNGAVQTWGTADGRLLCTFSRAQGRRGFGGIFAGRAHAGLWLRRQYRKTLECGRRNTCPDDPGRFSANCSVLSGRSRSGHRER